jgi:SAM-dependent methyltransferase
VRTRVEVIAALKAAYSKGESMTDLLKQLNIGVDSEMILLMYEIQSGSYTEFASHNSTYVHRYNSEIAEYIRPYVSDEMTILDCGTGESTNLISLACHFDFSHIFAIDISLSRLLWAYENSRNTSIKIDFAAASIFDSPLPDKSIDIVITNHALEPNGGSELELIAELGRVSSKYIFLIEPDYEGASAIQQQRMERLNFVTNLDESITRGGYQILERFPIINFDNPENKAILRIIDVRERFLDENQDIPITSFSDGTSCWVDPISKEPLFNFLGGMRSNSGIWYPVVNSIPVLKKNDGQFLIAPPTSG